MFLIHRVSLASLLIATMLLAGCTSSATTLTTGMQMQDAVKSMKQRGFESQQMAYAKSHEAFDLPDGRTVVLLGGQSVDEIQVISNPEVPQAERITKSVSTFRF